MASLILGTHATALGAFALSRWRMVVKDGKPIPVLLSVKELRDLDELAAEATDRPRGSLLTGGAPLHMQSAPTSLLALGGGTVTVILLAFLLVIPVAPMSASAADLEHRLVESASVLAFLLANAWVLSRVRTVRRLLAWLGGVTVVLLAVGGLLWIGG